MVGVNGVGRGFGGFNLGVPRGFGVERMSFNNGENNNVPSGKGNTPSDVSSRGKLPTAYDCDRVIADINERQSGVRTSNPYGSSFRVNF